MTRLNTAKDALIWLFVCLSAVLLLGIVGIALFLFLAPSICQNTVAFERPSPDGTYKAVVFDRDCGATTALSTQISILKSTESLKNSTYGNCVIFHDEGTGIDFHWKSEKELLVDLGSEPMKRNDVCAGVHVTYRIGQ